MNKLAAKKAQWVELIKEQEKSGLTQGDFCKERNLKFHQLHYYRHLLKKEKEKKEIRPATEIEKKVVPVKIKPSALVEPSEIRLLLQNGIQCVLPSGMEIKRIRELVRELLSC